MDIDLLCLVACIASKLASAVNITSTEQELVSSLFFCPLLLTYSIYLTPWNGIPLVFHASIPKPLTISWLLQHILSLEPTLASKKAVGFLYVA